MRHGNLVSWWGDSAVLYELSVVAQFVSPNGSLLIVSDCVVYNTIAFGWFLFPTTIWGTDKCR